MSTRQLPVVVDFFFPPRAGFLVKMPNFTATPLGKNRLKCSILPWIYAIIMSAEPQRQTCGFYRAAASADPPTVYETPCGCWDAAINGMKINSRKDRLTNGVSKYVRIAFPCRFPGRAPRRRVQRAADAVYLAPTVLTPARRPAISHWMSCQKQCAIAMCGA